MPHILHQGNVFHVLGASETESIPLYVPVLFLAWGVFLWTFAGRKMLRDPRGEFRTMAEKRSRSRVVRLVGGSGDPDEEFKELWRWRWLVPCTACAYLSVSLLMLYKSLVG